MQRIGKAIRLIGGLSEKQLDVILQIKDPIIIPLNSKVTISIVYLDIEDERHFTTEMMRNIY